LKEIQNNVEFLLGEIRSGKTGRDKIITQLYSDGKLRGSILSVILKMGGSKEDFDDIFSIALMQFVKTVMKRKDLVINYDLNTYITSIAKYTLLAQLKSKNKNTTQLVDANTVMTENPENLVIKKDEMTLLHSLLETLGKNCKEVLLLWGNGYKMRDIADIIGYKSEEMAKKKKYQCFKTLLIYLEQNPEIKKSLR